MNSQTALVTGASAGIGEAFARRLAKDGYSLVLVARRKERLDSLASELMSERDIQAEVVVVDLTEAEGRGAVEERLRSGDIELLVNNAGFGTIGEFHSLPMEREGEEIELNVVTVTRLTHAALAAMVPKGRGGILNVASTAAFQPIPYNATYAATKAFVLHFSEAVHEEVKGHGVVVTAVCPGPVRTEFQEVARMQTERLRAVPWGTADSVVDAALGAYRAGRAICIPGVSNVLLASGVRFTPRFVARRLAAAMFRRVAGK